MWSIYYYLLIHLFIWLLESKLQYLSEYNVESNSKLHDETLYCIKMFHLHTRQTFKGLEPTDLKKNAQRTDADVRTNFNTIRFHAVNSMRE